MALNINGTTGISGVDGSASAPALQGTDSNTGINFGSDTVNINTGGSTRATVNSAGRFLIGTTTAGDGGLHQFTIGDSSHTGITLRSGTSSNANIYFADGTSGTDEYRGYVQYQHSSDVLAFGTSATERMRIDSSGNIGIGENSHNDERIRCTSPYALNIVAKSTNGNGGYHNFTGKSSNGTTTFVVNHNGDVTNTNNSYGSLSDSKLKENITDASSQWNDVKAIKVRNFNFINDNSKTKMLGVIAQEIEVVSSGLVDELADRDDSTGEDLGTTTKSVKYSVLYMKAIKALQEAQTRIETLETENTQMKTDLTALTARVTALEAG